MTLGYFQHFVLTVAIEGSPLNGLGVATAPVKSDCLTLVADLQGTTVVSQWQADNERTELRWGPRGVNVRFELP